jgi:hypothetical protein
MNLNKYLLIGTLSVIATNALAEGQNIMTSKSYVDAQDALKQDNIPARATKIEDSDTTFAPSVVTNTTTAGDVGQMAIITGARMSADGSWWDEYAGGDSIIPTLGAVGKVAEDVAETKQNKIPAGTNGYLATHSGTAGTFGTPVNPATFQSAIDASEWQYGDGTLIPGVVIATGTDGVVAQRMILDKTQDILDSSISNLVTVGYDDFGAGGGDSIAYDIHDNSVTAADVNSGVPTTTMTVAIAKAAAKMTCAGWPDSVPVAQRTDENCWLWNKN